MVFQKAFFDSLLKKQVEMAEEKFDAEFDEKGTTWRDHDEDFQIDRMMEEVRELESAMAIPYGPKDEKAYRIFRLTEMQSEFIEVVICALMGADWCSQNISKVKKEDEEK